MKPPYRLAFDTNTISLLNRVSTASTRLVVQVELYVPTLVLVEHLSHQLRKGGKAKDIVGGLQSAHARFINLDQTLAQSSADVFHRWFPEDVHWQDAKRGRAEGAQVSAAVDWFIAAKVESDKLVLLTEDKGCEFDKVAKVVRVPNPLPSAGREAWVRQLLTETLPRLRAA